MTLIFAIAGMSGSFTAALGASVRAHLVRGFAAAKGFSIKICQTMFDHQEKVRQSFP